MIRARIHLLDRLLDHPLHIFGKTDIAHRTCGHRLQCQDGAVGISIIRLIPIFRRAILGLNIRKIEHGFFFIERNIQRRQLQLFLNDIIIYARENLIQIIRFHKQQCIFAIKFRISLVIDKVDVRPVFFVL